MSRSAKKIEAHRRPWVKPILTRLACKETRSGQFTQPNEGSFWIFHWGPTNS